MTPPPTWQVNLYRACAICVHGVGPKDHSRTCTAQAVAGHRKTVPVTEARANTGACGPEAHHLSFPGLLAA